MKAGSTGGLRVQAVDLDFRARTARLGDRPHPVPLDPPCWAAVERCLAHREDQKTDNPHVMVTRQAKSGRGPASTAYVSHVLDACGFPPRMIRCTRLLDLVNTMDPKLVAAAFGMDPEATMIYLSDRIERPAWRSGRRPTTDLWSEFVRVESDLLALDEENERDPAPWTERFSDLVAAGSGHQSEGPATSTSRSCTVARASSDGRPCRISVASHSSRMTRIAHPRSRQLQHATTSRPSLPGPVDIKLQAAVS